MLNRKAVKYAIITLKRKQVHKLRNVNSNPPNDDVKYEVVSILNRTKNKPNQKRSRYVKSSPPRPILQNIHTSTIMPSGKLSTTLAARMLDILKRGHQVRDTSETATETKNSSPATTHEKKGSTTKSNISTF